MVKAARPTPDAFSSCSDPIILAAALAATTVPVSQSFVDRARSMIPSPTSALAVEVLRADAKRSPTPSCASALVEAGVGAEEALCNLISRTSNREVVEAAVESVRKGLPDPKYLRSYFLLVESVRSEHRSVVSDASSDCLFAALSILDAGSGDSKSEAVEFVAAIVAKKDIHLLSTREILTLVTASSRSLPVGAAPLGRLVAAVLKHYTGAVARAVPVLAGVLRALLEAGMGDIDAAGACTRAFESLVPHASMVKKHCVPLLLDYAVAISKGEIDANRNEALLPGIHALLDACEEHEIGSLNAAMGAGERAAFAAVFKDYKRESGNR